MSKFVSVRELSWDSTAKDWRYNNNESTMVNVDKIVVMKTTGMYTTLFFDTQSPILIGYDDATSVRFFMDKINMEEV